MAVITRKPGRWDKIVYPPVTPAPRATCEYARNGAWTEGKRVGFKEIALKYGILDVWKLIVYNFQLQNPAEVNWAMNHFLGCTTTLDGKNYSFDRNDRNPKIYIPPASFHGITPFDDRVRDRVLQTMAEPETDGIRFHMGALHVSTAMFGKVAEAVRSRIITCLVLIDPAVPARAVYSQAANALWCRDPASFDAGTRARLVHECVHAGMDIAKTGGDVLLHEAAAHTAEALRLALALPDPRAVDPAAAPSTVGKAAMRLAKRIILHNWSVAGLSSDFTIALTDPDYLSLKAALMAIPEYAAQAGRDIGSNGI